MLSAWGVISHSQFSPCKSIHFVSHNPLYTISKMMARGNTTVHCQDIQASWNAICKSRFSVASNGQGKETSDEMEIKVNNLLAIKKRCSIVVLNNVQYTHRSQWLEGSAKLIGLTTPQQFPLLWTIFWVHRPITNSQLRGFRNVD